MCLKPLKMCSLNAYICFPLPQMLFCSLPRVYPVCVCFLKRYGQLQWEEKNIKNCTQQCLSTSVKPPGWKHLLDSQNAHFFF